MLATQFGTIWQQKGLRAAVSLSGTQSVTRYAPCPLRAGPSRQARADNAMKPGHKASKQASPLLIGYIDAQLGIGQSLRGLAFAIAEAGVPFSIYPFGVGVEGRRSIPTMLERYDEVTPNDVGNIIEVSPAELPRVFGHVSEDHFDGSYKHPPDLLGACQRTSGLAAEPRHGPDRRDLGAERVLCRGISRLLRRTDRNRAAVRENWRLHFGNLAQDDRKRLGLDPNIFYFMFSFDYYSFPERKFARRSQGNFLDGISGISIFPSD